MSARAHGRGSVRTVDRRGDERAAVSPGPSIETYGLGRRFGAVWALDDLSLDAEPGEVIGLLGPNGAGKTTTVRLLGGVLEPHRGHVRVLGLDPVAQGADVRRRTGVLTEAGGLDDRLSVMENLVTHARIRGMEARPARERAAELLDRFAMGDQARRRAQGLSTGERKRVALARALLHRPEVLLLDEPTSGLDPGAARDVGRLIAGLAADEGTTIVVCTHLLAEAGRLCDRVAILERGRLLAFGRPDDLAGALWSGLAVDLDLGAPLDEAHLGRLRSLPGVSSAVTSRAGARVVVVARDAIPGVVGDIVTNETAVFSVIPRPAVLEDVYFALTGGHELRP